MDIPSKCAISVNVHYFIVKTVADRGLDIFAACRNKHC